MTMCFGVNCGWHQPVSFNPWPSVSPSAHYSQLLFVSFLWLTAAQHEGHHRGRHAPGHISFFKRYDTVGALGAHLSAVSTPEVIMHQPHSAMVNAQARRASNLSIDTTLHTTSTIVGGGHGARQSIANEEQEIDQGARRLQELLDRTRELQGTASL